jgi:hypothetical protein
VMLGIWASFWSSGGLAVNESYVERSEATGVR